MSYVFCSPDRLAFEVRRVATERLDDALEQLGAGLADDRVRAIHEARKDIKKTRSLLRLVRSSLGNEIFREQNARLRAAAHELAVMREADALAESLDGLIANASLSPEAERSARALLESLPSRSSVNPSPPASAPRASALLVQARDDARQWSLSEAGFELLEPGVRRTYRDGRRLLARATHDPSDEALHEWRKRVKDMWYSLRLLGEMWPPALRPLSDEAHNLSDLLGDHHDLSELRRALMSGENAIDVAAQTDLLAAIEVRQAALCEAAISLGRKLYAEGPRRYSERLARLWDAWEADVARQIAQAGLPGS